MANTRNIAASIAHEVRYILRAATSDQQLVEGRMVVFQDGLTFITSRESPSRSRRPPS